MAGYYFLTLAMMVVAGFLAGRYRAASLGVAVRQGRLLHSLPTYHGLYIASLVFIAMLIAFIVGAPVVSQLATSAALSHFPPRGRRRRTRPRRDAARCAEPRGGPAHRHTVAGPEGRRWQLCIDPPLGQLDALSCGRRSRPPWRSGWPRTYQPDVPRAQQIRAFGDGAAPVVCDGRDPDHHRHRVLRTRRNLPIFLRPLAPGPAYHPAVPVRHRMEPASCAACRPG